MMIREPAADDAERLRAFFARVPDEDRGFIDDLEDPAVQRRWLESHRGVRLAALTEEGEFAALSAAWPGHGRSRHVGLLRLIVDPAHRRRGVGQTLARRTLAVALRRGLTKLTVEVVAEQQGTIDMFLGLGFQPEALLRDQLRDSDGALHDVVLLAHLADEAAFAAALAQPEPAAS